MGNNEVLLALIGLVATAFGIISYQIKSHSKTTDRFANLVERDIKASEQQIAESKEVTRNLEANTQILLNMKQRNDMITPLIEKMLIKKPKKR